jgi:hypothetical protein
VRLGPWLLLFLLLSTPAFASDGSGGRSFQMRTLVAPSRPGEVPPLELHASAGLTTLVLLGSPWKAGAVEFPDEGGRVRLVRLDDGSLVVALTRNVSPPPSRAGSRSGNC